MGMFDYVDYKGNCPICGEELTGWQSKDNRCHMNTLKPHEVDSFYTSCKNCNTWIDATVDKEVEVIVKKCKITFEYKQP